MVDEGGEVGYKCGAFGFAFFLEDAGRVSNVVPSVKIGRVPERFGKLGRHGNRGREVAGG